MPVSDLHDGPLEMLRRRPDLVTDLLALRGVRRPDHDRVDLGPSDITDPLSKFRIRPRPWPHLDLDNDVLPEVLAGARLGFDRQSDGSDTPKRTRTKKKRRRGQDGPVEGFIDVVVVYSIAVDKLTPAKRDAHRVAWEADFDGDFETEAIRGGRLNTLAVIVESQLRKKGRKRRVWLEYVAALSKRLNCPVLLLVITPSAKTAEWAARPIRIAHSRRPSLLYPEVIGPDQVPVILDPDQARRVPELAVLSGWMHARGHTAPDHFPAFYAAIIGLDEEHASLYADVLRTGLRKHARKIFDEQFQEVLMNPPYVSRNKATRNFIRARNKLRAEGELKGEMRSLLALLDARNFAIDADIERRITSCDNPDTLEGWVRRAGTATTTAQIFA